MPCLVLIEPICRGSRLQILANIISALNGSAHVILVTRQDYKSAHFDELMATFVNDIEVITINTDLGGAWMRSLTSREFSMIMDQLKAIDADSHQSGGYDLIFTALDDYLMAFCMHASAIASLKSARRVFCIKYRVEYLFKLSTQSVIRGLMLRALTRYALAQSNAKLVCFDERMLSLQFRFLGGILPDPWFGSFDRSWRQNGRSTLKIAEGSFVLMTIGKQDRRKGLDFLLDAAPRLFCINKLVLVVIGTVDKELRARFDEVRLRYSGSIIHIDEFVKEADLPKLFAAADAYILAYRTDFTATSGTLARAAASQVPVLASAHGLVGYRVNARGMGATYDSGDVPSFLTAVQHLKALTPDELSLIRSRSAAFARDCSLDKFSAALREIIRLK